MLDRMRVKEKELRGRRAEKWALYILKCSDLSLYTGITKDLERRFKMHSEGKAARYTRTRRPLELVYQETCKTRTEALLRECAVKALPKSKKLALIDQFNRQRSPAMHPLAAKFFSSAFLFFFFLSLTAWADTPPPKTSTEKLPDGSTQTTSTYPDGSKVEKTEKDGSAAETTTDKNGDEVGKTEKTTDGRKTTTTKLDDGTVIERSTLPGGVRETKIKRPDGTWVITRKGLMGVITTTKDAKGNLVTTMERNDGSGFERVVGPNKDMRQTDYDTEGSPVKTTKTSGNRTEETTYNKDGKPEKTTVTENGKPVEEIHYDANGQVKDRVDLRTPDKDKGKPPEMPKLPEPEFGPGSLSARDIQFDTFPDRPEDGARADDNS